MSTSKLSQDQYGTLTEEVSQKNQIVPGLESDNNSINANMTDGKSPKSDNVARLKDDNCASYNDSVPSSYNDVPYVSSLENNDLHIDVDKNVKSDGNTECNAENVTVSKKLCSSSTNRNDEKVSIKGTNESSCNKNEMKENLLENDLLSSDKKEKNDKELEESKTEKSCNEKESSEKKAKKKKRKRKRKRKESKDGLERQYKRFLNEYVGNDSNKLKQFISAFKEMICVVDVNLFEKNHPLLFDNWRKDPTFKKNRIVFPSSLV